MLTSLVLFMAYCFGGKLNLLVFTYQVYIFLAENNLDDMHVSEVDVADVKGQIVTKIEDGELDLTGIDDQEIDSVS